MTNDQDIQNQVYQCFLTEVSSLLPAIEQDLLSFLEEPNINKIHNLMRNAHTLKGSAASVERETIRTVAHHLEDVFKALYSPDINWDEELSALLWECYECLRESVSVEIAASSPRSPLEADKTTNQMTLESEETEILNRVAVVFAKLQTKLGDFFAREAPLPTSDELGFDVIGSIFAESMQQELQQLSAILATGNSEQVAISLRSEAEFFIGIAESYNLSGMKELAQIILTALERHPNQAIPIAKLALEDFQKARIAVLGGDRSHGGEPSIALRELAAQRPSSSPPPLNLDELVQGTPPFTSGKRLDFVKATNSKLFPEQGIPEDNSVSEAEVTPEPKIPLEPVQVEQNHEQLGTIALPQEQQDPDIASSSQLNTGDAIDQILQKIGLDPQECRASEDSDFSHQSASEQKTTPAKSDFSAQSSGKDVRVDLLQLERLNSIFGELLIAQNQQTLQTNQSQENTQKTLEQLQRCQQGLRQIRDWSDKYFSAQRGKLPHSQGSKTGVLSSAQSLTAERFDPLEMDAYSEMHILIQSVMETMVQLQSNIEEVDFSVRQSQLMLKKKQKLLTHAQENLLQARMLPLGVLLNRFPPILKQLVTINHKPAQLELSGTNILIDKNIAENLFDPLLHLLRNAIAHGIESSEVRRQRGKSETGRIRIHAYHQGNRTTIEVADDGQGLNWERIRQLGVEQQLLDPERAKIAQENELAELLFEPGFSTTEQITELSGRGVGLDVVRSQIQRLHGSVTVRSVAGEGTVFLLHLPLVLITAEMLVCQSNGLPYALLAESIERVLQPEPDRISFQKMIPGHPPQKFLLWGEGQEKQQIPIRTLASLLAYSFPTDTFSASIPPHRQKIAPLLMLRQQDQLLCLEVEQIMQKQELAIKSLSKKPALPSYIQGYSVLGDSRLVMVLDPLELVSKTWSQFDDGSYSDSSGQAKILPKPIAVSTSPLSLSAEIEQPSLLPSTNSSDQLLSPSGSLNSSTLALQGQSILIVDDSPTQRKQLVLMLEKAGCYVLQSGDGQEALTQLHQHPEIKIIICDIEMPTVNGFEFLYTYRQDANFSPVDVIMLTSRSGLKHRQMAFELGARAYLTKPYSEQKLLSLLSDLISQKTTNVSVS